MDEATNTVTVRGLQFCWIAYRTSEGTAFERSKWCEDKFQVLRIMCVEYDFDVVLEVTYYRHVDREDYIYLGSALVLGTQFPTIESPVEKGIRFAPRPKLRGINGGVITDSAVERFVQWCLSPHFRAKKCSRLE